MRLRRIRHYSGGCQVGEWDAIGPIRPLDYGCAFTDASTGEEVELWGHIQVTVKRNGR